MYLEPHAVPEGVCLEMPHAIFLKNRILSRMERVIRGTRFHDLPDSIERIAHGREDPLLLRGHLRREEHGTQIRAVPPILYAHVHLHEVPLPDGTIGGVMVRPARVRPEGDDRIEGESVRAQLVCPHVELPRERSLGDGFSQVGWYAGEELSREGLRTLEERDFLRILLTTEALEKPFHLNKFCILKLPLPPRPLCERHHLRLDSALRNFGE